MDNEFPDSLNKHDDTFKRLGDREPATYLEAQSVVEHIRAEKGYLDAEVVRELHGNSRRTQEIVFNIVKLKRETEAAYTTNISEQLYSSKYRFLYELIQNADDSVFAGADRKRLSPFLRFEVNPDSLIVETNEDGFRRRNVEAICATGRSSKKATKTDDHIGEKGFGFKSVFSIADDVHIQSGLWSFRFRHRQGEDGLGMVTPLDASPEELPPDVTTRMVLRFTDDARQSYARLLIAIQDIPDTTLLFLRRLRMIQFIVTNISGQREKTFFSRRDSPLRRVISRWRETDDCSLTEDCTYLLFKATRLNMPHHERRKDRIEAQVELAFPINSDNGQPKLSASGHHVFAFLPLQRVAQLQFLIHSDFVTSASRESVVDCAWNDALYDEVANTFATAVSGTFATSDHALRYAWLDYLPEKAMDHPWKTLYSALLERIQVQNVFQTMERRQFKSLLQVRDVATAALYQGKPILSDLADDVYLASEYTYSHKQRLVELGLKSITWFEFLDRLQADLVSAQSKIRTTNSADPWHEAFAKLMVIPFRTQSRNLDAVRDRIKKLALIPLTGRNQWTGAPNISFGGSTNVYFAFTGTTPIPERLSLRLLDKIASQNQTRRAFYKALGVEDCPKETVFAMIKLHHTHLESDGAVDDLRYMYHQGYDLDDSRSWVCVSAFHSPRYATGARDLELYLPSDGEFDMYNLLPSHASNMASSLRPSHSGYSILSHEIFHAEPAAVRVNELDWKAWLVRATGAMYFPPLSHHKSTGSFLTLSAGLSTVLKQNPAKFLSTLRAHWSVYQHSAHVVAAELGCCSVPCKSGKSMSLNTTYLPTTETLAEIDRFGLDEDNFPLLALPEGTLDETSYRSWKFLEDFGVCSKPDMEFYKQAIVSKFEELEPELFEVVEIYRSIASLATLADYTSLRSLFHDDYLIWDSHETLWVGSSECLLDGPEFITFKSVLSRSYERDDLLDGFFANILDISGLLLEQILDEITYRHENCPDDTGIPIMHDIYAFLASKASNDDDWRIIKARFKESKMILGEGDTWHTLETCVWHSPFALSDFQDLSPLYNSLEEFFVKRLNVKKASPSLLINEVKRMAETTSPRVHDIRTRLIEIGMMLARTSIDDSVSKALMSLKDTKFLPKKMNDGVLVLVGKTDDFAIADHRRYCDALADQDVLLDFDVHEVQILHVVFEYMGLTKRYLSAMVREVSMVGETLLKDEQLSQQLHAKAYALYCCAAKYKSSKALRSDSALFEQISQAIIYTTDDITTNLVLSLPSRSISVESDRLAIHHDLSDGQIKIYVPADEQQRRSCYRSQLPKVLVTILEVPLIATFDISSIVSCSLLDLENVLIEQDISSVEWIERPVIFIPDVAVEQRPSTPASTIAESEAATLVNIGVGPITPEATTIRYRRSVSRLDPEDFIETAPPEQYPDLIEQVVGSARQAGHRYRNIEADDIYEPILRSQNREFDHSATFGVRSGNGFIHDRRIGAAGEAYVFELLTILNIPNFTEANWRSTIRGELSRSTRFADMTNWTGQETADIVYKDTSGELTQYLRDHSEGDFPPQIREDHSFDECPIEYYLEVKSTTGPCGTRFYMSGGQYKRMETMKLGQLRQPSKVYVLMRVFDLMTAEVDMKIFVDPLGQPGMKLEFEVEKWFVTTK
ncbi:hypothetical protein HBH46_167370 [Parastagonospora nodorum]|nr:hypothetical protein HBH46_167370 [Parastagonospora nodorum]